MVIRSLRSSIKLDEFSRFSDTKTTSVGVTFARPTNLQIDAVEGCQILWSVSKQYGPRKTNSSYPIYFLFLNELINDSYKLEFF